jgi:hypothetical protein
METQCRSYGRLRTATNDAVRSSQAHTPQPTPPVEDDEDDDEEDEKGKPGSGGGNIDPDDDEGFSDDDEDDDDDETTWSEGSEMRACAVKCATMISADREWLP